MAADAVGQLFAGFLCQAAMGAFVDLIQDINVAVFTLLDTEEILEAFVDVPWAWMSLLLCNLPMAFQAGGPAMGRNMESFRINQPFGPGTLSPAKKGNRGEDEQTDFTVAVGPDSFRRHVLQPRARGGR
jgi:hypothetical protein